MISLKTMSGFTAEALEKKLYDLNNSQQSIQTLSLWLIHHRKHNKGIVNTWFKELKKAKQNRKLTFMYLANDVIQNSRKKGPEFAKEFASILKYAFENVSKDADDKTMTGLKRILKVWDERSIYDANQIAALKQALSVTKTVVVKNENTNNSNNNNNNNQNQTVVKNNTQIKKEHQKVNTRKDESRKREREKDNDKSRDLKHVSKKQSVQSDVKPNQIQSQRYPQTPEKKVIVSDTNSVRQQLIDVDVLIKALQELENSASSDATVREKIASLPPEVSDATLLDKIRDKGAAERLSKLVDEACTILADYNSRLTQELEDRKHISVLLSTYTQSQREAYNNAEQKLGEYKDKLRKVTQVRNELKSHLQNLPDLSRLPSVTGLAPLPSACDLFNIGRANAIATGSLSSASPNESTASPADYETMHGTPSSNTS